MGNKWETEGRLWASEPCKQRQKATTVAVGQVYRHMAYGYLRLPVQTLFQHPNREALQICPGETLKPQDRTPPSPPEAPRLKALRKSGNIRFCTRNRIADLVFVVKKGDPTWTNSTDPPPHPKKHTAVTRQGFKAQGKRDVRLLKLLLELQGILQLDDPGIRVCR